MAHVLRLMVVLALGWVHAAWALVPTVAGYRFEWNGYTSPYQYTSQSEACEASNGYVSSHLSGGWTSSRTAWESYGAGMRCAVYMKAGTGAEQYNGQVVIGGGGAICPANSSAVSGGCQCNSPYVEGTGANAGTCVMPPDACAVLAGMSAGQFWKDVGCAGGGTAAQDCTKPATRSFLACDTQKQTASGKCLVAVRNGTATDLTGNGWWQIQGEAYYTGSSAPGGNCSGLGGPSGEPPPGAPAGVPAPDNPASPTPGEPAPAPCPEGQAPGAVNGVTACYPTGGDKPTVTDAPGNGSSTVNKPDGSSTTTSQSGSTTCKAGTCTTTTNNTTVITNKPGDTNCPAGTTVGSTTKDGQTVTTCTSSTTSSSTGSQAGFCKDNPSSKQCGDGQGSAFGGTCAAGFKAVSDDAVLNAMAEEQYKRNCQFFEKKPDDTEESLAYEDMKAKGKAGVDQTNDLPAGSKREVSIGPGDFDGSNALGGAACITDRTIVVMGRTISLPFSQLCVWLGYMGTVLLACSYLVAARIVMGAK